MTDPCVNCGHPAPDDHGGVLWHGRRWCARCIIGQHAPADLNRLDLIAEPGEY